MVSRQQQYQQLHNMTRLLENLIIRQVYQGLQPQQGLRLPSLYAVLQNLQTPTLSSCSCPARLPDIA